MNDYPDQAYGELREGLHVAGYTLERAFQKLERLLTGDAWARVGAGFSNVNDFLDTLRLEKFRAIADERQTIVRRIKELQPEATNRQIARTLGVGHDTVDRDLGRGANAPTDPRKDQENPYETGANAPDLTGAEAAKAVKRLENYHEKDERRDERLEEINRANRDLPTATRYPILYADPPWRYEHPPMGGNRVIENHYPTMTLDEICELPVDRLAADDSLLYLWATAPKLSECMEVIRAWGFDYRTNMIWVKDKIGMGYYARNQHELLLVAKRGAIPPPAESDRVSSVVFADRTEHSAKPPIFYDLIERWYPQLPKIELFSRSPRQGWAAWGNQAHEAA